VDSRLSQNPTKAGPNHERLVAQDLCFGTPLLELLERRTGLVLNVIRQLKEWTLAKAAHPHALWILAIVSFVESSIFPIPPDVMLIPMVLAQPSRAYRIAFVCMASSVLGGLCGYFIGFIAFDAVGKPILELWGLGSQIGEFSAKYNQYGGWAVLVAGITPFPYKVITILSGATQLQLPTFIVSSIIARGARFFLVTYVAVRFGPPLLELLERRLWLVLAVGLVLLLGSYYLLRPA